MSSPNLDALGDLKRTHMCGELRPSDVGAKVTLLGWVQRRRDLGRLIFLDVRDRSGLTQIVTNPENAPDAHARADQCRPEFVIAVEGEVVKREKGNASLPTGEIEVAATKIHILNDARTPPFPIEAEVTATEETRLRHRYLDLRRPLLQKTIPLRHKIVLAIRKTLDEAGFYEIETPFLTRSTPEGARDYLVPSRVHPGQFYALPQSPQIFKQLLMISGFDRYFQIVRCFRDEDLRADRQPEFTQLDLEISFATPDQVFAVIEKVLAAACAEAGVDVKVPFLRLAYAEAMARYGSDKPDTRFGMELKDVSEVFVPVAEALKISAPVHAMAVPGAAGLTRKQKDALTEDVKKAGGRALYFAKVTADGVDSPLKKNLDPVALTRLQELTGASDGDLILMVPSGESKNPYAAAKVLGELRVRLARELGLIPEGQWNFLWVTDFPLFEWSETGNRWASAHHPFTGPADEDLDKLSAGKDLGAVRSKAYDLVLNGTELGSGSIRIHRQDVQQQIFKTLGMSDEEAKERFGFFLDALTYGTPPHGGIALGIDRIVMLLVPPTAGVAGATSLRDVIAFPKTAAAQDLMADAPSPIESPQESELGLLVAYHGLDRTCWDLANYADRLTDLIDIEVFGEGSGDGIVGADTSFQQAMALILVKARDDARAAVQLAKAGYGVQSAGVCRSIVESSINARYIDGDRERRAAAFLMSVAEDTKKLGKSLGRHHTDEETAELIREAQRIEEKSGWPRQVIERVRAVEESSYTYEIVFHLLSQIVHSKASSSAGRVMKQAEGRLSIGYGKSDEWVSTALATVSIYLFEILRIAQGAFSLDEKKLNQFEKEFNAFHGR